MPLTGYRLHASNEVLNSTFSRVMRDDKKCENDEKSVLTPFPIRIENSSGFKCSEAHTVQGSKAYGKGILLNDNRNDVYDYAARHEFGHTLGFSHARPGSGSLMSYDLTTMRFSNAEVKRLYNVYK